MSVTVSCVIPTHLRPTFLRESLASVLAQTLSPREVIVVSDVKDDSTRDVCLALQGSTDIPISFVEHLEGRGGASSSRNAGANRARGRLLAFLDDDDIWCPEYLATSVSAQKNTDADLVVTWLSEFSGGETKAGAAIQEGLRATDAAAMNPGATGSNIVVKSEVFAFLNGYDVGLRVKNDTDFFYRFLQRTYRYVVVPRRLVLQRKHALGQLTAKTESRAHGTELYLQKHRRTLSLSDRRTLLLAVHRIRAHSARSSMVRRLHRIAMMFYYTPSQLLRVITRGRDQSHFKVNGFSDEPLSTKHEHS